ncbi:MAG TPA: efflux RND transporter periplasmic adaptor subunit [Sphingomonas sp.]|nr:efflux RND transporter periplasmic adaptor subunit [Sphingomonas sp.]
MISALCAVLAACSGEQKRETPTPEAGYVVVRTQAVSLPVTLAGRTSAYETSEVRPQVSGVIRARQFTEGSIVRQGQTLYQIDPSIYRAAADQARANVAAAEATRSAAAVKAGRLAPLARIEAVSQQDYTDAAAQSREAAAQVAVNRAALETARVNLRFTRVPAPITGRIGRSLVTTGGLVTANQADPLTTIQRLDPMFVDIQQSSADMLALRRSLATNGVVPATAAVRILLEDGSAYPYAGTLQFTEAMVDQATGSVTLRVAVPNPQGLLLPGMYVRAAITQAAIPNAILVPQAGVSRSPRGRATVLLVGPDNKAVLREVTADRTIGDTWLVTAGLKPGDKVIVEGLGKVKVGQTIVPVPAGSKPLARSGSDAGTARAR